MEMYTFFIYEKKILLKKYERDEFIWIMMWCHDDAFDLQLFFFRSKKKKKILIKKLLACNIFQTWSRVDLYRKKIIIIKLRPEKTSQNSSLVRSHRIRLGGGSRSFAIFLCPTPPIEIELDLSTFMIYKYSNTTTTDILNSHMMATKRFAHTAHSEFHSKISCCYCL